LRPTMPCRRRAKTHAPDGSVRAMKSQTVQWRTGESITLFKAPDGKWCCPVCGSPELAEAPYNSDGGASFEMCSCGFEFGFDDDPGASAQALPTVAANLERWRAGVMFKNRAWSERIEALRAQLRNIGVVNV
jgi:hypothetical protein